jgi:glutathione synthase/RimK-type ligase-like ATP-grasp enzyme
MKKFNNYFLRVFSRHPSHSIIRKGGANAILYPKIACILLGSTTEAARRWNRSKLKINSPEACNVSSNKILMKGAFKEANIKSPEFWENSNDIPEDMYPIIAKRVYGSRADGIRLFNTKDELIAANLRGGYYFEKYYNYAREYRLHCTPVLNEMFYTCRKMLKKDTPEDVKFYRNDKNCSWFIETNPDFNKPANWDEICQEAIKATKVVGLDIGAVDVRVKSKSKDGKNLFQIIEVNSAPSFAEGTANEYMKIIPRILNKLDNAA